MEKDKKIITQFITALEDLMLGMQQIDSYCLEAYDNVSKREFTLLVTLGKSGSLIMREVASLLGIPMSTATGAIDKLIEKGYVRRTYSEEDRRVILIVLSKRGREIYEMLRKRLFQFAQQILKTFPLVDQKYFVQYLQKAVSALQEVKTVV